MTAPVQVRQIPGRWRRRRWEAECVCLRYLARFGTHSEAVAAAHQHAVTAHPNPPNPGCLHLGRLTP